MSKKTGKPKRKVMDNRLRDFVHDRDGDCVARGLVPDVQCGGNRHVHHLWLRSQGGPDEPWNLKSVCLLHHDWIHAHPAQARELDLLRRSGQTGPDL